MIRRRRRAAVVGASAMALVAVTLAGCGSRQSPLDPQSTPARVIADLWWWMLAAVGFVPATLDRVDGGVRGAPAVGVKAVAARGGGEEQQRFAEGIELEMLADPVADHVVPPG